MIKNFLLVVLSGVFIFSCAKKDDLKKEKIAPVAVESESFMFSPSGSDFGQAGNLQTINFEYDKATLTNLSKEILKSNYNWLKNNPEIFIQIEGHCDNRGTIEYNLALGDRRALTVKNYLIQLGLSSNRISTISYGEEKPLCNNDYESCWSKNRRSNFVIVSR